MDHKKPKLHNDVLCPDGVDIYVNWRSFEPGMSIFIPAVDLHRLKNQMATVAMHRNFKIKSAERIEGGRLGMRFWRIS